MNPEQAMGATRDRPDGSPLQKLLGSIESLVGWSLGRVGLEGPPRYPRVCLEKCLQGSPEALATSGCEWLRRMVHDEQTPPPPAGGRCEKQFPVYVPRRRDPREPGRLFAVHDVPTAALGAPWHGDERLAELWEGVLNSVEQVVRDFASREEENVRLVEEVLQGYEQLNILFEVTKASISMVQPEEMYDFALDRLSTALRAPFACFYDAEGRFERTIPRFEKPDVACRTYRELLCGRADQAIGEVLGRGVARTLELADEPAGRSLLHSASVLVVPLISGEEVLGGAVFGRPGADPFRTGDCSMAEAVMGQVAITAHKMRLLRDLQQMSFDVVGALVNAIDAKDEYTCGHSDRVARWSVLLGRRLNLDEDYLQMLAWAGRLHDVGKIGIRDEVLGKPGHLTEKEFAHIKEHPAISFEVLKPIHRLAHVLKGVRHHHEAWDGSGYPDGLAGEGIPLEARIIQMADVFDALTSTRSYRQGFSLERALQTMREDAGKRLDPNLVEEFIGTVERARTEAPELFEHIVIDADREAPVEQEVRE